MKKTIFLLAVGLGLCISIYFYLFNFNNMSETMLINSVLYWYVPLIFGLYGITAQRISNTIDENNNNTISHLFSGKDTLMITLTIILIVLGGIVGILLFFIPLLIFKPKTDGFDIKVAVIGTVIWLIFLYGFFILLWPSL